MTARHFFRFYRWIFSTPLRAALWFGFVGLVLLLAKSAQATEPTTPPPTSTTPTTSELQKSWEAINPWGEEPPKPPEVKPFELPRLTGDSTHFNTPISPYKKAKKINADSVFLMVTRCFPAKSAFDAEVSLVAGFKDNLSDWDEDLPDISDHYVGIVGRIPLYSSNEQSRQREREFIRRNITAQHVAGFISAIAKRNQKYRELGLYRALEARASARVIKGIAETGEQVMMLEKTAAAHAEIITQEANVIEHRIALAGLCQSDKRDLVNNHLKDLAGLL
ncbi:hypothetical protein BCU50_023195 [Vibrio sp. 10N.286.46.E10]|uniref:hypothetical protein n=1 Tax=Vibrio sp. 10N.286.46.E10 TaxID=1884477 RepID=UPI000C85A9F2|nr:hypothetical protein [Vibrio sp. 10N.286.46.E10]